MLGIMSGIMLFGRNILWRIRYLSFLLIPLQTFARGWGAVLVVLSLTKLKSEFSFHTPPPGHIFAMKCGFTVLCIPNYEESILPDSSLSKMKIIKKEVKSIMEVFHQELFSSVIKSLRTRVP